MRLTEERYRIDYTIIDLNPGLSAINQNLFLISHAFIIPTNPDPFSLMALDTLKTILPRWTSWKQGAINLFEDSAYPFPAGVPKFIGTLIQRFNIRKGRAAAPYRDNIAEIKDVTSGSFVDAIRPIGMVLEPDQYGREFVRNGLCLSEIPDFQGLLPKAYDAGVPVFELTNNELEATGPILVNMMEKRELFRGIFANTTTKILSLMEHA